MSIPIPPNVFTGLVGEGTRTYVAFGDGSDLDNAFDNASRGAQDCEPDSEQAWMALADASHVSEASEAVLSPDGALSWAVHALLNAEVPEGQSLAVPVAAAGAYKRSKLRVVSENCDVRMPEDGYTLLPGDTRYTQAWDELVSLAGQVDGEIQRIDILAVKRRFRPVATPNRSASAGSYVIVEGDTVIEKGFATAGEARRAAVEKLKAMSIEDGRQPELDIVKIAARVDGPLIEVRRVLLAQKTRAVVHVAQAKPAAEKINGWLLLGRVERQQLQP